MIKNQTSTLKQQFDKLAETWRKDCMWISSMDQLSEHPAYQQIIAMGQDVVPILLEEMQNSPDHWSMALHAITGADPLKDEHRGKLKLMAQDWVEWGKQHGYLS